MENITGVLLCSAFFKSEQIRCRMLSTAVPIWRVKRWQADLDAIAACQHKLPASGVDYSADAQILFSGAGGDSLDAEENCCDRRYFKSIFPLK
jgi:hypothetical protein